MPWRLPEQQMMQFCCIEHGQQDENRSLGTIMWGARQRHDASSARDLPCMNKLIPGRSASILGRILTDYTTLHVCVQQRKGVCEAGTLFPGLPSNAQCRGRLSWLSKRLLREDGWKGLRLWSCRYRYLSIASLDTTSDPFPLAYPAEAFADKSGADRCQPGQYSH
jgi:hypothetical protein